MDLRRRLLGKPQARGTQQAKVDMKNETTPRLVPIGRVTTLTKAVILMPPTEAGSQLLGFRI